MADPASVAAFSGPLRLLGRTEEELPRHPILHGTAGTLLTIALPLPEGKVEWAGIWIAGTAITFLGAADAPVRSSAAHGVSGAGARVVDLLSEANRRYLLESEELDARVALLEDAARTAPARDIWALQREATRLRGRIARSLVVAGEVSGLFADLFPGAATALPAVVRDLERARDTVLTIEQSLGDLLLMRNAEASNRIAETANRLSEFSNRIAVLTNTSNIRMLGITYLALLLGLVSATILFLNTGATILGMPSAAWVPGIWVDVILIVLTVVPIAIVFSRPWVALILRDLRTTELRSAEGIHDLPEVAEPAGTARTATAPVRPT